LRGKPAVLILGPSLAAISGVTTHVSSLLSSRLRGEFALEHFQVGSEGRSESAPARLARFLFSPFALAAAIVRHDAALVHINSTPNVRAYWRDLAYLAVAKLCGARVVLQQHGGNLREFSGSGLFAAFVRATLRLADAIVVLSSAELAEYRGLLPGKNVRQVPNGIDLAPYQVFDDAWKVLVEPVFDQRADRLHDQLLDDPCAGARRARFSKECTRHFEDRALPQARSLVPVAQLL